MSAAGLQSLPLSRYKRTVMSASPDELVATAAREFARALAARWQTALGTELLGVYLIGSLAHGGFSRRYSDVDMAAITESGLAAEALDAMHAAAADVSPELAPKLSIFWTNRRFGVGRFPPLDRGDYLEHAVTLTERERVMPARPTLEEVRGYLAGIPFAKWAAAAQAFAASNALDPKERKSYLRALLYPARFVFSWMTGRIGSNDEAVAYLADQAPLGLDVALARGALVCRQEAADPDPLFADRTLLPRQVAACAALISESAAERP
jgi:hypothetical protein